MDMFKVILNLKTFWFLWQWWNIKGFHLSVVIGFVHKSRNCPRLTTGVNVQNNSHLIIGDHSINWSNQIIDNSYFRTCRLVRCWWHTRPREPPRPRQERNYFQHFKQHLRCSWADRRGRGSVPLALTVSKFENFDPFLALKLEGSLKCIFMSLTPMLYNIRPFPEQAKRSTYNRPNLPRKPILSFSCVKSVSRNIIF